MVFENKPIGDALWWCTVTWFTVGYGDLYPLTGYGRLFGMYVIISSHIFIVLLTANVVAKLSQYRAEAALEEERRLHKQEMALLRARFPGSNKPFTAIIQQNKFTAFVKRVNRT